MSATDSYNAYNGRLHRSNGGNGGSAGHRRGRRSFDDPGAGERIAGEASTRHFPPGVRSVREARRHVHHELSRDMSAETLDCVDLLVSELATNAVTHARSPFAVRVGLDRTLLRIDVFDEGPPLPPLRSTPVEATSGRGLKIVDSMADRWGSTPMPHGKSVWFELDR